MSKLIQSFKFAIDKYAEKPEDKYIALKGSAFSMAITTEEGQTYSVNAIFNFSIKQPVIQVYAGTDLIQGNTVVREYPTNLLLCDQLNNYGLFYNNVDSIFEFYKLEGWYDHGLNYWQLWEKFRSKKI